MCTARSRKRHGGFRINMPHLSQLVTYLNHRSSNKSRKHPTMDRSVLVPSLDSGYKFIKRDLHRIKELQENTPVIVSRAESHGFLK
jgi:hypothetical protein